MTSRMLSQIADALNHVHTRDPPIIHRDIKPANILYQGSRGGKFLLTDFGIAKVVDTSKTLIGTPWYAAPEVILRDAQQTPKVDIFSLGVTVVECLVELESVKKGFSWYVDWRQWYKELEAYLKHQGPRFAPMLANDPYQRPTARELLEIIFSRPLWTSSGVSIYPAAPTTMDWTQTAATAIFHRVSQPTQQNESKPPQPNTGPVQTPKAPLRLVQPRARRGGSVKSSKSTNERQRKGHRRSGSSQSGPSRPARVPKRRPSSGRPKSRSVYTAQELGALGI